MRFTLFRSVRFNIALFCLIAASAALGTFLPQIGESPEKVQAFMASHHLWGHLFELLGLFNLYHSAWFMGLLGLMAFDIVVCKLYQKPPDPGLVRLPQEEDDRPFAEAALELRPYRARIDSAGDVGEAADQAEAALQAAGYATERSAADGKVLVTGTRHRAQRWGSYTSHVALVVLLAGALIKALFGFEEMVPILEGRSRAMRRLPWEIHVDRFKMSTYPGTRNPSSFESDLRVYDTSMKGWKDADPFAEGRLLGKKTIRVNDPLSVSIGPLQNVKLYQASWGAGGMFRSVTLSVGGKQLVLPQRTRTRIPGTDLSVEADLMLPDFDVAPDGSPSNKSLNLDNPAVRFVFRQGERETPPLWLFENWPDICMVEEAGKLAHAPPPPFRLAGIDPVLFSGIQVAYDPGFPVVVLGSVGMLVGLSLLFYLHRRRVWALALADGPAARLVLAGWSSRGPNDFSAGFRAICDDLRRRLKPAGRSRAVKEASWS